MKQGWEYKKLGELSSFIGDGDWIESKDQSTNGIRLIQTGNIGNGVYKSKEDKPHYISERTFKDLGCTEIFEGDCLVSRLPDPVGRACLIPKIPFRAITAVDCTIIRFNERVLSKYFVYYTQSTAYSKRVYLRTTGSTRKRISRKNLEAIDIPLPPLSDQQSIVAELDKINEIIDLKKAQLKDLDLLAQSIFYDMFGDPIENPKGWNNCTIESVCNSIVRGPFGSALKKEFFVEPSNDTYKVYEQKHAIQKSYSIGSYYITKEKFQELHRFEVRCGDIIMSCSGTIGEFYQIPDEAEKGVMNQALLKFTLNEQCIKTAFFLFLMNGIKNSFETKGTGLQNIGSVKIIKSTVIGLPPLSLQQSFASKIQAIESQKSAIKQSLAEVETLLASRMDYWFG